ncbi:hypothetical protein ACJRO7_017418 [Eucalyptus globulus]|uniref:Uncharacterized protein n=1 Tax=Eucalyptus globulus TaxID=34317 RepID=A0ABD3KQ33_EUCGL
MRDLFFDKQPFFSVLCPGEQDKGERQDFISLCDAQEGAGPTAPYPSDVGLSGSERASDAARPGPRARVDVRPPRVDDPVETIARTAQDAILADTNSFLLSNGRYCFWLGKGLKKEGGRHPVDLLVACIIDCWVFSRLLVSTLGTSAESDGMSRERPSGQHEPPEPEPVISGNMI